MKDVLSARCGMRIFWRKRDLLILTGRMRNSYKIDDGLRDENQKITHYVRYVRTAILTTRESNQESFCLPVFSILYLTGLSREDPRSVPGGWGGCQGTGR